MKKYLFTVILIFGSIALFAVDEGKITIMDFTTENSSVVEMQFVTDYIAMICSDNTGYSLLDRFNRGYILEDKGFTNSDCTDRACQAEAAKQLPIDFFITGSIKQNGDYQLIVDFVDAGTGRTLRTESGNYTTFDNLLKETENLVLKLLKKESPAAASANASTAAAAGQTAYKPKISGSGYQYNLQGVKYLWAYDQFPLLADKIVNEMPESMEAKILQGAIDDAMGMRTGLIVGGGLTLLGSMALWLPPLIDDTGSELLWIGAGVGVLGYVLLLVGALDESDVPIMADLVKLYNRR